MLDQVGGADIALAAAVMVIAGLAKGLTGFAMPLVAISGLASLLPPDLAVAVLILPTLVTNIFQAGRDGTAPAMATARRHWRLLAILLVLIAGVAQVVPHLPPQVLYLTLGVAVTFAGLSRLGGWKWSIPPGRERVAETVTGVIGGIFGGIAGIWGPPIVVYLVALGLPKAEMLRTLGVAFLAGAVVLAAAHLWSGLLNRETALVSALMVAPGLAGLWAGQRLADRLDEARFEKLLLAVLVVTGLNLLRKGFG
jgi:uncharacterized membrane protein YfcA